MKIQLAIITRNRKGQAVRAEKTLEAEAPAVGRGAQCAIHLPDPRVALEHATIFKAQGAQRIAGVGGAVMVVEGRLEGEIVLAPGSRFEIGPYLFSVEQPPPGFDLALMYELVRPLPDGLTEIRANSRFTLAEGALSKRATAWSLFGIVALLFLLLPILVAVTPPLREATAGLRLPPDLSWNPGPLSAGHTPLLRDCGSCHQTPFLRVRDKACLACHENTPGHVHDVALQNKLFGGTRCAECHVDHQGADAPLRTDSALCRPCHEDLKRVLKDTLLEDVKDFAKGHPEFRPTLWRGPGKADVIRVAQSDKLQYTEKSNLKFPHDQHLKQNMRTPKGRVTLECRNCHVPDASGKQFLPVDMKKHCLECHTLDFEPAVTSRQVPHGSVEDALLTMQEFYANITLGNVAVDTVDAGPLGRVIPKASAAVVTEEQRRRALEFARTKAQQVGVDLFEKRVCIVCHDVKRSGGAEGGGKVSWTIAPVHVNSTWMPKAHFDHGKHRTAQCKDCHDVERSKRSADIALPDIESCRTCHTGDTPAPNKVVSTCISCHAYHVDDVRARKKVVLPTSSGVKQ